MGESGEGDAREGARGERDFGGRGDDRWGPRGGWRRRLTAARPPRVGGGAPGERAARGGGEMGRGTGEGERGEAGPR
jgi:hypothetical protein